MICWLQAARREIAILAATEVHLAVGSAMPRHGRAMKMVRPESQDRTRPETSTASSHWTRR
jgi:hypothetical protein